MVLRKGFVCAMLLAAFVVPAHAKDKDKEKSKDSSMIPLTPEQNQMIDRMFAREKATIAALESRTPLVETYLQNMRPDPVVLTVPESDYYALGRVTFSGHIGNRQYHDKDTKTGFFHNSGAFFSGLSKAFKLEYTSAGFTQMMVLDTANFDRDHYEFGYVGRAFLGDVRTYIFDVAPTSKKNGGFRGRIWVEDQAGNIVRFNGVYTGSDLDSKGQYFHFDSWRTNSQPTLWLPSIVYAEESRGKGSDNDVHFKAQSRVWGYSLKVPSHEDANASVQVEGASDQSQGQDVSPLEASRMFTLQAENNVLDRLQTAGLVAIPSPEIDGLLETVTNNLVVTNNLPIQETIHCRVLLTDPLESLAVGNTILLSRGLIDTLPDEQSLASVLAFQLAHIALGHKLDTRFAFNDRLLFPNESVFEKIPMGHTTEDNLEAAKKAMELLNASPYKDKLPSAGLYFRQLHDLARALPHLNDPRIGDSLINKETGAPWLADLESKGAKLEVTRLDQTAALPLGSRVKLDSWSDQVFLLHAKTPAYYTARDKMPFEVTPVAIRLTRYSGAAAPAAAPAPAATPGR